MNKLIELIKNEFQKELSEEPFHMLDLGCSGGISSDWRLLEPFLRAMGIDLNAEEVKNLNTLEENRNIKYYAGNLELSPDHPIRKERGTSYLCESHTAFAKTSAWDAHSRGRKQEALPNNLSKPDHVNLETLLQQAEFSWVDFVKIDVDGPDFDVLQSLEQDLKRLEILGFKLEVNLTGTDNPHDHTFHNMDRLMKRNGFELLDLDLRRYTKKALPGKFLFNFFGQTERGALAQGDALYIRKVEAHKLSKIKLVKIIALLSLFGQIDSAADLVKEGPLAEHFQSQWLDLAAQMFGHKNYADLMLKWTKTPKIFYRDGIID
jgi:hypothetical protein